MMKKHFLFFSLLILSIPFNAAGQASYAVSGIVRDSITSEPLAGANVLVLNNSEGNSSDKEGRFELFFSSDKATAILHVKFIGYKEKQIVVSEGQSIVIVLLSKEFIDREEVVITDSKIPQSILESPVTRMQLDAKTIAQLPQENFYSGLISAKGIDITTGSLFFQNITMRGPANPLSETVLQLTDGIDNTPPGQGFSVGNLNGENDLDIESIEIIPGSSSAIYGANAFSGLINITSKNPFLYRGLSVQLKSGINFIDGRNHDPALFTDYQLRYAKVWKEKFALKVNIGYAQGTDWMNLDQTDWDVSVPEDDRGIDNPGRDLLNIFGDEIQETLLLGSNEVHVSRTGYNSNDVLGLKTDNLKFRASLHYKLNQETELSYLYSYSFFTSNVQPTTWKFDDFRVTNHKLEIKNKNYFVRLYSIHDHDGHSFDGQSAAQYVNANWKSDSAWFSDYSNAYNGLVPGISQDNHSAARNYADIGMPAHGSEVYNQLFSESADRPLNLEGGSRFEDETNLQHLHAQYNFSSVFHWMKIIAGVEGRSRDLWSNGTMYLDYPPAHYINTKSIGTYVQCEKDFFQKRLVVLGSVRYDKYDGFQGSTTPRIAGMYKLNEKNFIRASYQVGSRAPDAFDQYRDFHNGRFSAVGGLALSDEKYQLHNRSFELNSFWEFIDSSQAYLAQYGEDSTDAAIQLYKGLLKPSGLQYIHSETVQTAEIGYQCLLFDNKLHLDIDIFGSIYKDLMAYKQVVMAETGNPFQPDSLDAAAADLLAFNLYGFDVPFNYNKQVRSGGIEAGVEYNFWKRYTLAGNFCYQEMSEIDPTVNTWLFMAPPFKTNVSLSNPSCYKNVGFSINWHWTDAVGHYWSSQQLNPDISNNYIHANSIIDAQVTLELPRLKSFVKFGASNLLNHYYQNVAYGASVGGVYYISIVYNGGN